jgi:hypothetical protein
MVISMILGLLIFGYAAWTMIRHVKRSRKGKCAACSLNETCQVACAPTIVRPPAGKADHSPLHH